jgi:hypothetical protein
MKGLKNLAMYKIGNEDIYQGGRCLAMLTIIPRSTDR